MSLAYLIVSTIVMTAIVVALFAAAAYLRDGWDGIRASSRSLIGAALLIPAVLLLGGLVESGIESAIGSDAWLWISLGLSAFLFYLGWNRRRHQPAEVAARRRAAMRDPKVIGFLAAGVVVLLVTSTLVAVLTH